MKAIHTTICIAVMFVFCSAAHSWGVIEKGPYLQNVGKARVTIMWESLYTTKSRVDYGLTKDYDLFIENTREVELHEVTLRPLRPNTRYYYKITCGLTTKTGSFKTAPNHNLPLRFVVYGDSRDDPNTHREIARGILKAKPDFIMHVGDLVNNGRKDYQWESQFFEPLHDVINHIPIFYANLEFGDLGSKGHGGTYWDDNGGEFARVGVAWLKYQLMEENGPDSAQMFEGENCGLCGTEWIVQKKNME